MCGLEFPDLEANIWQRFKDRGVQVIALDPRSNVSGDTAEVVEQFIAQTGITFPVAWDSGSYVTFRAAAGSALSPFPLDVVIAQDGSVAYLSREYDASQLQAVIEGLLEAAP